MIALFVPFAPSLAHVSRCLAAAEAWQALGHTAIFAVGQERAALIEAAGFATHHLPEIASEPFRTTGLGWMTEQYFTNNLAAEHRILEDTRPDIVVSDFRFTTSLAAKLAGVPSASILHGSALCFATLPAQQIGRMLVGDVRAARGAAWPKARMMQVVLPLVFHRFMQGVMKRWNPILQQHGVPEAGSPYALLAGDAVIAADLPDLLPSALPRRTYRTGPLMWSGWEKPAPWLDELDSRPLIYVTMGSTVEAQDILAKIISAFDDGAYNIVASVGNLKLPRDLRLPPHVRIFPTVPGATVLRRSAAIVHLGGHGTLMQALSMGVPSLLLPANPDQVLVAQQAQRLGIARSLWGPGDMPFDGMWQSRLSSSQIRCQVDLAISNRDCRERCADIQRSLSAQENAQQAAKAMEQIIRAV